MTLDKQTKKELSAEYTQTFRAMGVFQIRNVKNGKIFVGGSMDLNGFKNRLEFGKQMNTNTISELQQDWNQYGGESFVFEELDQIKPKEEHAGDREQMKKYRNEVDTLLELWLENLQPYGDKGYNRRKRNG
ncbi:GIY-YIG nuclease family protein [Paenibacillus cremeus]|uniref:GIY-YIG nuclease family protein n=1 Tax=Paenibacillus cremeus TaxID=2163881 RepID=A0A559KHT9_9BACL|nr:GIY-YIG nuclease family protein [Paenibacillus cremeus]TVY11693.1 GIY-YIG nuclease family protein [Paenibacillus cremeus]